MSDATDPADWQVSDEEMAVARARVAALGRLPNELFGRVVTGDGVRGDCLLGPAPSPADPAGLVGRRVAAKRLGWDDGEDGDPDRTPFAEQGYDSPDLEGVLARFEFVLPDGTPGVGWEVGGQPADPATVRPAG